MEIKGKQFEMKKQIVAPCGIACFNCELYCENVTPEAQTRISEITRIPPEKITIISSYLRNIWKTTQLKDRFTSSLEVIDEMRSIRCIEHRGKAKFITPFIGGQIDICHAFGFKIPEGCDMSKKKTEKKRGRPRKTKDVIKLD